MGSELAGCCGDFCGKCPNYPGECRGCRPADHADCDFVACCQRRGLAHCGECGEFPCEKLSKFVPDDRPGCPPGYHIENLRRRRAIGTIRWLQEQEEHWS